MHHKPAEFHVALKLKRKSHLKAVNLVELSGIKLKIPVMYLEDNCLVALEQVETSLRHRPSSYKFISRLYFLIETIKIALLPITPEIIP